MKITLVFGIFGFYLRDTILEKIELAHLFHRALILSIIFDGAAPPPPPPKKNNFGKPWKFGQMLGKIKKIRADLSESRLNSDNFITIQHKNSGKLSTAPLESISPIRL
jgi:hypothetical protein